MAVMRCSVYARYSSSLQSPTSITDQIRKCREFAHRQGWGVLDEHVYTDEAVSATSAARDGLQRLMAAATLPACPFDCILIDDTSRLSRDLADSLSIFKQLNFAGVRLVSVSQGIDTSSEQAEVLVGVHGLVDSLYIRELASKVRRGMEGCALNGLHTGGRCFGYRNVPIEDPTRTDSHGRPLITGVRLEVNEAEAEVVRRIFRLYAEGHSLKQLARKLNEEGVRPPRSSRRGSHPSWSPAGLSVVLKNTRYVGRVVWNRTRKVRTLDGKRRQRPRPCSEWLITDAPALRIVSDELFAAVQARLRAVADTFRPNGQPGFTSFSPRRLYLFSGLLKCGECGSKMVLVSGGSWGRRYRGYYGCPVAHRHGMCRNLLTIRRTELEKRLLGGLQVAMLREEAVDYAVARLEEELKQRYAELDTELEQLRQRKGQLETEIKRLADAIATGQPSQGLMAAITEREKELHAISDKLLEPRPGSLRATMDELKEFAVDRLTALRGLLSNPDGVPAARAMLAKHIGAITLRAVERDGQLTYEAVGAVDFFTSSAVKTASLALRQKPWSIIRAR